MKEGNEMLLEIRDLTVQYSSNRKVVHAVNGISFQLREGETLGLLGETGVGKTTIAKTILRILPASSSKVTGGDVLLEGKHVLDLDEKEMREIRGNKIAMIFQDPMTALNPIMTVGSQITEVILNHNRISTQEAQKRAEDMLEMVGIPRIRYNEYPNQFSGGMKQRVVIAMALACNPRLLLADEPTTALDVTIQAQVLDMMKELKERMNTSIILITHDLGVIAETCDAVAVVYAGMNMESASKEQLFNNPLHPYTKGLFGAIPRMDDDEDSKYLHPIDGLPPDPTNLPSGCPFSPRCPDVCDRCRQGRIKAVEAEPGHFVRCIKYQAKEEMSDGTP